MPATLPLLDPKNDFVFKRLFTARPALLADLINAVRHDEPPVVVVEILNPRIEPEDLAGKSIVLDVLARDDAGRLYNIEMQVRRHPHWNVRSAFYLARTFAAQLLKGEDYTELRPAIGIHLMDFDLFDDPQQAHWRFELRDRDQPHVALTSELLLNLIELPKADRLRPERGALAAWVAYFEHWQESTVMNAITHPPIRQALDELEELSSDIETRHRAMVRERALRDEKAFLRAAREEGLQEGRQEGLQEGRQEGLQEGQQQARTEFAHRLFSQPGLDDASIAQLTGLSEDEVRRLRTA